MSQVDKKQELYARVNAARARGQREFARAARQPKAIAYHAYHSSIVEGRSVSLDRLERLAHERIGTDS